MELDSKHDVPITKIGFGSCNNQLRNVTSKSAWERIAKEGLQAFVWSGDVVYSTKGNDVKSLREAYGELEKEGSYYRFVSSLPRYNGEEEPLIFGTFDDHDFGVNDGGKFVGDLVERQQLFLEFLSKNNGKKHHTKRNRNGVYSSHEIGVAGQVVRIILLDTRSGRSDYVIPGVGHLGKGTIFGKLSPFVAALTRTLSVISGLVNYDSANRKMLDEQQWKWLEYQIKSSKANVNLIVSSVQVFTKNPSVESWGHFPTEKARLKRLVFNSNVSCPLILSGDVHIGEYFTARAGSETVVEVTSSGITHSFDRFFPRFLMFFTHFLFNQFKILDNILVDRNFGRIVFDWKNQLINVTVINLSNNTSSVVQQLSFTKPINASSSPLFDEGELGEAFPIVNRELTVLLQTFVVFLMMIAYLFVRKFFCSPIQ